MWSDSEINSAFAAVHDNPQLIRELMRQIRDDCTKMLPNERKYDFVAGQGVIDPGGDLRYPHEIRLHFTRAIAKEVILLLLDRMMYGDPTDGFWLHLAGNLRLWKGAVPPVLVTVRTLAAEEYPPDEVLGNWRLHYEDGTWWAQIKGHDSGIYRFCDCTYACVHCGDCIGCLRKMIYHDYTLHEEHMKCPQSPTGYHEIEPEKEEEEEDGSD